MSSISPQRACLISLWFETLLYGIFLVFFCTSIYVLLVKKLHGAINRPLLAASILMFLLISAHLACDLVRAIQAFTTARDPFEYYSDFPNHYMGVKAILYYFTNLVGDTIILYRCWTIWNHDIRVMVVPMFLYITDLGAGVVSIHALININPEGEFFKELTVWFLTYLSLTVTVNTVCTLLIATRIWYITRSTNRTWSSGHDIRTVAIMLIESAAIYPALLFVMIGTFVAGTYGQYIALDSLPNVVGIVFELIIVRVGLGYATDEAFSARNPHRRSNFSTRGDVNLQRLEHPRHIDISVETAVEVDSGMTKSYTTM
ncbi:hypothetical protein C8J56DRAFT_1093849 [Mycena floridula]|nr:hypothetical protein C8J56DRAFT_1093849 [Mycena floridula]